jgi:eukaryotic-like serine/threonine-protein kinase
MMSSPVLAQSSTAISPHALTQAAHASLDGGPPSSLPLSAPPISSTRFTVLPRAEGEGGDVHLVREERARYQPVRSIATGGMGEVLLMNDQDIARPVAIKRLLPELDDAAALLRFVEEIRTIGQLEHPNIVPIHDVGVDEEGRYFFVMKYVEGETLAEILERLRAGDAAYHRRYTVERRVEIALGVLHALEFAHARGILHRDVKPANVMVGRFGEVVVMDWGIAKPMAAARAIRARAAEASGAPERALATRAGAYVGTPAYMAPEQALGKNDELDARSDLYSAAVLLHELLTLRHYLGERDSVPALLAAVAGEEVTHRSLFGELHPHEQPTPVELRYVVGRGLQKDPARRFQSASDMIEALQHALEGRGAVLCQVTFTKRMLREMGRFVDRHPRLFLLATLAVVASVVFTSVALVQVMRVALA